MFHQHFGAASPGFARFVISRGLGGNGGSWGLRNGFFLKRADGEDSTEGVFQCCRTMPNHMSIQFTCLIRVYQSPSIKKDNASEIVKV